MREPALPQRQDGVSGHLWASCSAATQWWDGPWSRAVTCPRMNSVHVLFWDPGFGSGLALSVQREILATNIVQRNTGPPEQSNLSILSSRQKSVVQRWTDDRSMDR